MKSEGGKSIVTLLILTILIIIGVVVTINYAKQMMAETREEDLKTNMLLMQVEVKKGLEEVCFQTVNLNESKQEDINKINEIKGQYLKGTLLSNSPTEVQEATKTVPEFVFDENCYYLDEETLRDIGIENVDATQYGYFIVKYNFTNADVEVINTNGTNGKYILTQIVKEIEEIEEEPNEEPQEAQS